jgi:hypothetical protein
LVLISGGDLKLAALTRGAKDAETKDHLNVSINIDGNDVVSRDTLQWAILRDDMIPRGNASIAPVPSTVTEPISFDSASLTNSSIRVGITGDNMWAPEHILLLGREDTNDRYIRLAGEWDVNTRLSTDFSDASPDAKLTIPLRLIRLGGIGTTIRRVLLLVKTSHVDDAGSRDPIVLVITAGGTPVLNQAIGDTSQDDRFEKSDNWYTLDVMDPFNKRNVMSNGGNYVEHHRRRRMASEGTVFVWLRYGGRTSVGDSATCFCVKLEFGMAERGYQRRAAVCSLAHKLSRHQNPRIFGGFTTVSDYIMTAVAERALDDISKYFFTNKEREKLYNKLDCFPFVCAGYGFSSFCFARLKPLRLVVRIV